MNDSSTPERIMVEVRAREAEQTFTAFVELKLIHFEDHYYERTTMRTMSGMLRMQKRIRSSSDIFSNTQNPKPASQQQSPSA